MSDLSGQLIRSYELRERIGAGRFGAVYRAFQPSVHRQVAIKVILPEHANRPNFIRRFEAEAHFVARLEHPYIVPLYDFWREPGGAYLVMRWLDGGSLRDALGKNGPWSLDATAQFLDQIVSALMLAHRHGIIHRDIKPDNILLDTERNAFLADFGIAKDVGQAMDIKSGINEDGAMLGSPAYISPEQIMGAPITPAADQYSLGIVLYEILTASVPFQGKSLILEHLNAAPPSLRTKRPDLPEAVDKVVLRALAKDPADRFPDVQDLATAIRQSLELSHSIVPRVSGIVPTTTPQSLIPIENPYKGLRAFQEADASDFFGRNVLIDRLLSRLIASPRLVAVVGASGSGKSSVVRAGLLTALRQGRVPGAERWFYTEFLPGEFPLEELEVALLRVAVNSPASAASLLTENNYSLLKVAQSILPNAQSTLVIFIDQFEELFTRVESETVRNQLLDSLVEAINTPDSPLRFIITLRADFMDRPLQYSEFGDLLRKHTEFVLPLSLDELREAIVTPAMLVGVSFENGLTEAIMKDFSAYPGALPLLQYALTELFESRNGHVLTLDAYQKSGGVLGALSHRGEELYNGLDNRGQLVARQLFLRLVTLGEGTEDTRRRIRRSELTNLSLGNNYKEFPDTTKIIDEIIDLYTRHRLLTLDRDPVTRVPTVEISHEALIRSWARLHTWLAEDRDSLALQRRLTIEANEWTVSVRDSGLLASGTRLAQYEGWLQVTTLALNQDELEYLQASKDEHERRAALDRERKTREATTALRAQRFGRAALILGLVGALAMLATILAISQAIAANTRVIGAQTEVALVEGTLTPIPVTLAAAASKVTNALQQAATVQAQLASQQQYMRFLSLDTDAETLITSNRPLAIKLAMIARNNLNSMNQSALLQDQADSTLARAISSIGWRTAPYSLPGQIMSVAFSPDSRMALVGTHGDGAAGKLIAVDLNTWESTNEIDQDSMIDSVAFDPQNPKLALTGDDHGVVKEWQLNNGKLSQIGASAASVNIHPVSYDDNLNSYTSSPITVAFGSNEWRLAATNDGRLCYWTGGLDTTISVCNQLAVVDKSTQIRTPLTVQSTAFDFDGTNVLIVDSLGRLSRWRIVDGTMSSEDFYQNANGDTISDASAVSYIPGQGDHAVLGKNNGGIQVITLNDLKQSSQVILGASSFRIRALKAGIDGRQVLSVRDQGNVDLWDLATGTSQSLKGHLSTVVSLDLSPNGQMALTGSDDAQLIFWDLESQRASLPMKSDSTEEMDIVIDPEDSHRIITGDLDGSVKLWTLTQHPNGRITIDLTETLIPKSGNKVNTIQFNATDTYAMIKLDHGGPLLTWSVLKSLGPVSTSTLTFPGGNGGKSIFNPVNDHQIATSYFDPNSPNAYAVLWDIQTQNILGTYPAANTHLEAIAISPDGKTLVASTWLGQIVAWNIDQPDQQPRQFTNAHKGSVTQITFLRHPDPITGHYLAISTSGDKTMILWDVNTGTRLHTFSSIGDTVNGMAISPDSTRILSTSNDLTLHLWGIQTGTLIGPAFVGHQRPSLSVVFGPDGKWAISSGDDLNGMIVWNIPSLEWACTHRSYQTPLTAEQMSRYEITQAMIDSLNTYCSAYSKSVPKS